MVNDPKRSKVDKSPFEIIETNKIPILIVVFLFIGTCGFLMYKAQISRRQVMQEERPQPRTDSAPKDDQKQWFNDDKYSDNNYGMKKISAVRFSKSRSPQEVEKDLVTNQQIDYNQEVVNDQFATKVEIEKLVEKEKVEAKKMEIMAASAPMNVDVPPPPGSKTTSTNSDQAIGNDVSALSGLDKSNKLPSSAQQATADLNNQDEKKDFLKENENNDGDYVPGSKVAPKSPYEVKAGTYIPATLVNGIDSDLPGPVTAQVSENVYDTVSGNDILIPQGTRIIGSYDSKVTYGQSCVLVKWTRLIFPDGKSIDIGNMEGGDISGFAGLHDKLNNHYLKIYGNALMLSLVGAGYDLLNNQQSSNLNGQFNAEQSVAANVGQKLADVSSQTLQKNMDVQPTITIDPGYRFNVLVTKDMVLEKIEDVEGSLSYSS
jgi:type IV secretory pathway VirB10-like protein